MLGRPLTRRVQRVLRVLTHSHATLGADGVGSGKTVVGSSLARRTTTSFPKPLPSQNNNHISDFNESQAIQRRTRRTRISLT
jgi:hypothetical protein